MKHILTPTGWRVLSESDGNKDDEGKYPPGMTREREEEIKKLWKETLDKARKKRRDNRNRRGLDESQIELLESLYEDGYLNGQQLDEIFKEIVGKIRRAGQEIHDRRLERNVARSLDNERQARKRVAQSATRDEYLKAERERQRRTEIADKHLDRKTDNEMIKKMRETAPKAIESWKRAHGRDEEGIKHFIQGYNHSQDMLSHYLLMSKEGRKRHDRNIQKHFDRVRAAKPKDHNEIIDRLNDEIERGERPPPFRRA